MLVVNLYGGPCAGKSTVAMGVAHQLKMLHFRAEYVSEYAKGLTLEGRENILEHDQLYIFAKQHRKLQRLEEAGCQVAISDSPLLLVWTYFSRAGNRYDPDLFRQLVFDTNNTYNNRNYFLQRDKNNPYQQFGRSQNEEVADLVATKVQGMLLSNLVEYRDILSNELAVPKIVSWTTEELCDERE